MRSNLWTELTTKGIYGKGNDRELAVIGGRRGKERRGDEVGEEKREEEREQAQRQSAELSW